MNFDQAIKWMKEGKKVTRKNRIYLEAYDEEDGLPRICRLVNGKNIYPSINYEEIEATDWEIYKESIDDVNEKYNWNLVSKEIPQGYYGCYKSSDIRILKSILIEDLNHPYFRHDTGVIKDVIELLDRRFGF